MKTRISCALALLLSAGLALAQTSPAAQPEKPATPTTPTAPAAQPEKQPDALSGPKVTPKEGEPTLIKYDFNGKLVRPDAPPEEAALDLVGLDAGEKEAVTQLVSARAAILDRLVADNLPLLLKFQGVRAGDNMKEQMQALKDLTKTFAPVREMGPLRDQAAAMMAAPKAAKYKQILDDYWQAVTQEDTQNLTAKGKPMTPPQVRGYETMLAFGVEVRRSYTRQIEAKTQQLNELLATLKATPEQDEKIHKLTSDFFQKTLNKPTPQQRRELIASIMKELTDDQQLILLKELYAEKK